MTDASQLVHLHQPPLCLSSLPRIKTQRKEGSRNSSASICYNTEEDFGNSEYHVYSSPPKRGVKRERIIVVDAIVLDPTLDTVGLSDTEDALRVRTEIYHNCRNVIFNNGERAVDDTIYHNCRNVIFNGERAVDNTQRWHNRSLDRTISYGDLLSTNQRTSVQGRSSSTAACAFRPPAKRSSIQAQLTNDKLMHPHKRTNDHERPTLVTGSAFRSPSNGAGVARSTSFLGPSTLQTSPPPSAKTSLSESSTFISIETPQSIGSIIRKQEEALQTRVPIKRKPSPYSKELKFSTNRKGGLLDVSEPSGPAKHSWSVWSASTSLRERNPSARYLAISKEENFT